jgi:hypothetical protein
MAYYHGNIVITNNAERKIHRHNLTYDEVISTFNYPNETGKGNYGGYKHIRDFGSYKVGIIYSWDDRKKVWVIISCWSWVVTRKTRWHFSNWWISHILG